MNTQSDQVKGHAKSVAGIVTGNKDLQAEGDAETRTADAAAHIDDAKDKAVEVLDHIKDRLDDAADKAKDALHKK
ncbi:MAG: CsbD family protein [Actinomycetales bacterium]|nr:CsbD family protein [Actinomycetales bacterium]